MRMENQRSCCRDELLQLDLGALGVGPECLGLDPGAGQAGEGMPDIVSQHRCPPQAVGGEEGLGLRVDVSDPPLVIAPEERFTHPVEDLGGVAGGRILPQQNGEPFVGRGRPGLRPAPGSRCRAPHAPRRICSTYARCRARPSEESASAGRSQMTVPRRSVEGEPERRDRTRSAWRLR